MEGILIYDERDKDKISTIFAKEGFVDNDPKSRDIILTLLSGELQRFEPKTKIFQKMKFDTYDLRVEMGKPSPPLKRSLKSMRCPLMRLKKR